MQNPPDLLQNMKVTPLASESFGVRSMCTLVQTPAVSVLLDAGVSLCPWRFGLPPHPIEFQTITRLRQVIAEAVEKATVTTISHYHYDHHTPSFTDWVVNWTEDGETARQIYHDKIILAKNPKENINDSQRERSLMFQKTGAKHAKSFEAADGKTYTFGDTKLVFSRAVAHGSDDHSLGWVIMTTIQNGDERFMFAPDVQGPMSIRTAELILAAKPTVLMMGGPPLYLEGNRVSEHQIKQAMLNLERIVEVVPLVVLEHHALRDEFWRSKLADIFQKAAVAGHAVVTAAEFAGEKNMFLEAKRKQFFKDYPVSEEFRKWTKTLTGKKVAKPPL
jgi:predicted metallo-beta-lactamase superfamily hydrolase